MLQGKAKTPLGTTILFNKKNQFLKKYNSSKKTFKDTHWEIAPWKKNSDICEKYEYQNFQSLSKKASISSRH